MPVLSPTNLSNLRTQSARATPYLSFLQPATLLVAQVAGAHVRGSRSIAYDTGTGTAGQFATIEAGQTIWFYTDVGIQLSRVKSITGSQVTGTIVIDENDLAGSAGNIPDNTVIEIYHNYEIQPIPPVIRSQIFYKFFDLTYTNQNLQPSPVAIAGPHRAGFVSAAQSVTVQIATGPDDGATTSFGAGQYSNSATTIDIGGLGAVNFNDWWRFVLSLPTGITITSATIKFTTSSASSNAFDVNITSEDALGPTAPTSYADYNSRVSTTASVNWTVGTAWALGEEVYTPDLSTIFQELVDTGTVTAANILIKNNGSTAARQVVAYDSSPSQSAILSITYTVPLSFTLDATPSYAIASGATITNYLWSCVKNGGGTTGITIASTTDPTTTITFENAGQYWLKLIVTDSNAQTETTYRAIFVYDTDTPPYIDFTLQPLNGDWKTNGYRLSLEVNGDSTLTDIPDKTLCLLWYYNEFNGTEGYVDLWQVNADNIIMQGYIRQDSDNDNFSAGTGTVSFEFTTPEAVVDSIWELGSITLETRASPAQWWQYATWMTTGRGIHHLLKWHSYGVLQCWDVYGLTDDSRGVKATDFTEPSVLQQANSFAFNRGIYAKLTSNRLGQMFLVTDSQILNDAGRAALDTVMIITKADVSGQVDVIRQPEQILAFAELNGFSFDGSTSTPFISVIPGYRESSVTYILPELRGVASLSVGNQVLSSQTDSDERVGRVVAQENNNPREIRFTTPSNYLGAFDIVPSIGWYEWGISDGDLKRDTELLGRLLICRNVSHTFVYAENGWTGQVQTSVVFEPEAFGPDGVQGNYPTTYPTLAPIAPSWDDSDATDEGGTGDLTLVDTLAIVAGASTDNWYTGFAPGSSYIFDDYPGFPATDQYRTLIGVTGGGVLSQSGRTAIFDGAPFTQSVHYYTAGTDAEIIMGGATYWVQPPASGSPVSSAFTGWYKSIDWLTASSVIRVVTPAGTSLVAWIKDWNTGGELSRTYNIGITGAGEGQHVGRISDTYALVLYVLGGVWVAALVYTDLGGDTLTLIVDENGPACDTVNVSSCVLLDDNIYGLVYTNSAQNYFVTVEVAGALNAITWGTPQPTTHGITAMNKVSTTVVALAYIGNNGVNDQVLLGTINTSGSESPAGVLYTSAGGLSSLIPDPLSVITSGSYILVAYGDENGNYFVASASQA